MTYSQKFGHGTAVAIFKTKGSIAVAADSRITWTTLRNDRSDKPEISIEDKVCKIFANDHFIFTAAECAFFELSNFNVFQIAKEICSTPGDIMEKYKIIENKIVQSLIRICKDSKMKGIQLNYRDLLVDFVLCGMHNNELSLVRDAILPNENTWLNGIVQIQCTPIPNNIIHEDIKILMGSIRLSPEVFNIPEVKNNSPAVKNHCLTAFYKKRKKEASKAYV